MTGITQGDMKYIEEGFLSREKNTRLSFDGISDKYGDSGLDEIIKGIGPVIPKERNRGDAVYSFPGGKATEFGNDYATVEKIHKEKGLTWYDISDDGFTRKNPGMESDFIDII